MKLNVGMYIRYISGFHHNEQNKPIVLIGKILEITDNELIKLDTFFGGGMFPIREFEKLMKGEPSFNPIDLIEVGDYVNGVKVRYVGVDSYGVGYIVTLNAQILDDEIKTILTKEQFEANAYEVV